MIKPKIFALCLVALLTCINGFCQDYFLNNKGPFNSNIPSPEAFLGYPIGEQHTRHDQIVAYFNKLADEIIRHKSMSEYILNSDGYLTSTNDEYIINKDEVIIPQSIISKEYLSRLEKMSSFKHPYENIYDNVNPFNGKEVKKTVVEYKDKVALKKRIKLKVKS